MIQRYIFSFIFIICTFLSVQAQVIETAKKMNYNADSVRAELDKGPYFTLYKDNYFIAGTAIGNKPNKYNTDVKFQISISQKLTKSRLPFDSYLFIQYTQKCFWGVLQESLPMTDLNFNPGIGLAHMIVHHNRYIGKAGILIEHESNGRDGKASRSWNRVTFSGAVLINRNVELQAKAWIPIIDGENNRDILDYCGLFQVASSYISDNRRFWATCMLTKRKGWNMSFNTVLEVSMRLFKRDNQYLFLQYYNGYGEGLLEYNQFHSRLRLGFVIKPSNFSNF